MQGCRDSLGRPVSGPGPSIGAGAAAEAVAGRWQPGDRWERFWHVWAHAARSRSAGCLVVTPLAGGANLPAEPVPRPACTCRPNPVVGLAERGRIGECCRAACHVAPGGREADLIADDTVFGDRDRIDQRLEAPGPGSLTVTPGPRPGSLTVRPGPGPGGPEPCHQASPACHARSPRVPGVTP
jgi:hypothetical protein